MATDGSEGSDKQAQYSVDRRTAQNHRAARQLQIEPIERSHRAGRLLSNCTSSISAAYVQAQLGIKDFARRKAMSLHKNNKARGGAILDSAYDTTNRQGGCRLDKMVQDIIVAFFFEHTHIDSAGGAKKSLRRKLTMRFKDLQAKFVAQYPAMLRARARNCPSVRHRCLTKLQKDVQAAVWAAEQPGFDLLNEFSERKDREERRLQKV